jgi:MFS family permease
LYWLAQLTANVGAWMQIVATGWLVLALTDSPAALGLTGAFSAVPLIALATVGGAVADRFDRYRLVVVGQVAYMLPDLILAVLVATGLVQVWHVYVYALANATVRGLLRPAGQAIVPSLVPREALLSAVALNSILWQGAAVIGSALAGVIIVAWGMPWAFYLDVVAQGIGLVLLLAIRLPAPEPGSARHGARGAVVEGMRYAWSQGTVRALLIATAAASCFGMSYTYLMPVFARDVLDVGPSGLGLLLTMPAAGTILAGLVLASAGQPRGQGRLFLLLTAAFALALTAFAVSGVFWLSLAILLVVGAAGTAAQATGNTLVQQTVPDGLRGRVLGFWIIATQGAGSLGALPGGLVAEWWGAPAAVTLSAAVVLVVVVTLALPRVGLRTVS